jgi:hypothetical protein
LKQDININHEFVEFIPGVLEDGKVYVSIKYATASHRCCCGCGNEVVTPISPTDWSLTFDGETVSLDPSIGNWSLDCKSHYWIRRNRVKWAQRWSDKQIEMGRALEQKEKKDYYASKPGPEEATARKSRKSVRTFWKNLTRRPGRGE